MRITVKVTPNAPRERVEQFGEILKVYVNTPPEKGKANKAVIELLAKYFQVAKSRVFILRGVTSREKVIEIEK